MEDDIHPAPPPRVCSTLKHLELTRPSEISAGYVPPPIALAQGDYRGGTGRSLGLCHHYKWGNAKS